MWLPPSVQWEPTFVAIRHTSWALDCWYRRIFAAFQYKSTCTKSTFFNLVQNIVWNTSVVKMWFLLVRPCLVAFCAIREFIKANKKRKKSIVFWFDCYRFCIGKHWAGDNTKRKVTDNKSVCCAHQKWFFSMRLIFVPNKSFYREAEATSFTNTSEVDKVVDFIERLKEASDSVLYIILDNYPNIQRASRFFLNFTCPYNCFNIQYSTTWHHIFHSYTGKFHWLKKQRKIQ